MDQRNHCTWQTVKSAQLGEGAQVTVQMEKGLYLGNMKFKMSVEEQWGLLLAILRPELGEFSFIIINKSVFFLTPCSMWNLSSLARD